MAFQLFTHFGINEVLPSLVELELCCVVVLVKLPPILSQFSAGDFRFGIRHILFKDVPQSWTEGFSVFIEGQGMVSMLDICKLVLV